MNKDEKVWRKEPCKVRGLDGPMWFVILVLILIAIFILILGQRGPRRYHWYENGISPDSQILDEEKKQKDTEPDLAHYLSGAIQESNILIKVCNTGSQDLSSLKNSSNRLDFNLSSEQLINPIALPKTIQPGKCDFIHIPYTDFKTITGEIIISYTCKYKISSDGKWRDCNSRGDNLTINISESISIPGAYIRLIEARESFISPALGDLRKLIEGFGGELKTQPTYGSRLSSPLNQITLFAKKPETIKSYQMKALLENRSGKKVILKHLDYSKSREIYEYITNELKIQSCAEQKNNIGDLICPYPDWQFYATLSSGKPGESNIYFANEAVLSEGFYDIDYFIIVSE